jgi:hypothetical protein
MKHTNIKKFVRRMLIGSVSIMVMLVFWPALCAHAQFSFPTDLFNTVTSLGNSASGIQGTVGQMQTTQQTVVYPLSSVTQFQSFISTVVATYRSWMSQVYNLPLRSAQLGSPSSLELAIHSGSGTAPTTMFPTYVATYGTPITTGTAATAAQQTTDMNDAIALDALSLATATDQGAANLISVANQLEDQSLITAPGTADMITAQAMALQLQSLATQHMLLASELRQEAGQLAARNADLKSLAVSSHNNSNLIQNLLNTGVQQ